MPRGGRVVEVGGRPLLRLVPAERRVRIGLVLTDDGRAVDLSRRPSAVLRCLDEGADRAGTSRADAQRDLRAALDATAGDAGAWRPSAVGVDLRGEVGGAAFPLLGAAYDRGRTSLDEVPPWAVPILACPRAGAAAQAAFGPAATRPTARALAAALACAVATSEAPPSPPGLAALSLAVAGAAALDGDRITRLLDEVTQGTAHDRPLAVDEIATTRAVAVALAPARAQRVLAEAGTTPGGLDRLVEVGRLWPDVGPRLPRRLPPDLTGLRDLCRSLAVTDRAPERPPRVFPSTAHRPPRQPVPAARPAPAPPPQVAEVDALRARVIRRQVAPPATTTRVGPATALPLPAWLANVDRRDRDGISLVLPRTVGDLERWGRLLRSCIGDFGPAVVERSAALVGLFAGPELIGCLHLAPDRSIVQMLGHANRPLPPSVRTAVLGLLVDRLVLDPDTHANRPWFSAPP